MSAISEQQAADLSDPWGAMGRYFDDITGDGGGDPIAKYYGGGISSGDLLYGSASDAAGSSPWDGMFEDDESMHPGKVRSSNIAGQTIWVDPEDAMNMS